ncbi:VTT domain-containing protein [Lysobacter niastensis]|uniref:TVP38/TMEM64 family membrane protein n=2 Tax=Lysobacter niastensis TaxID=380629 RepID=A0ABS0B3G8_9GAMM|nr:VTT domain-containing protein [Lysobacter niastensis]
MHAIPLRHALLQWRTLAVLLGFALLVALLSVDRVHAWLAALLATAEPVIAAYPVWGAVAFVLVSALSAMLAFLSSALLVPVAVYSWGTTTTVLLLWLGWWLGGACAFAIGRLLRRPLVHSVRTQRLVTLYVDRVPRNARFPLVFVLQLALPSEVPGYLCGLLGVRFSTYAPALMLAELPYAIGTVMVGQGLIERQAGMLMAVIAAGLALSLGAVWLLRRWVKR